MTVNGSASSGRPGLLGGLLVLFAAGLVALAAFGFGRVPLDGPLFGAGLLSAALALLTLVLAVPALQLAGGRGNPVMLKGLATAFTLFVLVLGISGAVMTFVLAVVFASPWGMGMSGALLLIVVLVAAIGWRTRRIAAERIDNPVTFFVARMEGS
ncbi:hypothetical protein [Microbacterium sp.]|uniref:hypothetical protein n=1 Tax=Microbacterium sp. TaxID=51671 RepID=UPI0039E3C07D